MSFVARIGTMLRGAALASAALAIVGFVSVALLRIPYPFQLEWLEGESLHFVKRVLSGEPIYVAPSLEFIPFLYNPLYFYVAALPAKILGLGLPPLRLVSFVAALGCLVLIFEVVRRETRSPASGLLAAGLFAATYRIGGAFLDLARVDSLFLFLSLGAFFAAAHGRSVWSGLAGGILLAAAWQTKQLAAVILFPVALHLLWVDRVRGLAFAGSASLAAGASVWVLFAREGPWYRFYVHDLPASHEPRLRELLAFWPSDVASHLPIAAVLALFYLAWSGPREARVRYGALAGGLLAAAWLGRLNPGGYENVLLPGFVALAIGFGLGAERAVRSLAEIGDEAIRARSLALFQVALLVQIAGLAYDPTVLVPNPRDRAAGEEVVERLRRVEGAVFVPGHGYLAILAGKEAHAHQMAIRDASGELSGKATELGSKLRAEVLEALEARRFGAIVHDDSQWLVRHIERHYRRVGPVFDRPDVFWPPTGHRSRPSWWFEPDLGGEKEATGSWDASSHEEGRARGEAQRK